MPREEIKFDDEEISAFISVSSSIIGRDSPRGLVAVSLRCGKGKSAEGFESYDTAVFDTRDGRTDDGDFILYDDGHGQKSVRKICVLKDGTIALVLPTRPNHDTVWMSATDKIESIGRLIKILKSPSR